MSKNIINIFLNALPVIVMIGLIPLVSSDFLLAVFYCAIIAISFLVKYERRDYIFFIFGLMALTISEMFFVSTGVEVFRRASLFGAIPIWLPLLWAYAFVAIKRSINILNN